jgi:S1-C subfamily serine protease
LFSFENTNLRVFERRSEMERAFSLILSLWLFLSASSSVAQHSANAAKTGERQEVLRDRLSHSVVVVETLKFDPEKKEFSIISSDSGVVVLPNQVITNRHVVDAGDGWRIKQGEKSWRAIVTDLDPDHDLALLRAVDESLETLKGSAGLDATPVSMRLSPAVIAGEHVYAIGSPDGQQVSISEGVVSGFRDYQLGRLIQTSAPLYLSSSGGGLFDLQGRLVGITSRSLSEGHNLNFALPTEWAQALLFPQTTASPRQSVGESEAFSHALTATMNLQTMVFERRLLHDRTSNPVSARAASWLMTSSHLKCVGM